MSRLDEKKAATRPDERQSAVLIAYLLTTKGEEVGREITRARLSANTLQRLLGRQRLSDHFVDEVQEWLFRLGWILFFAGNGYAVVKMDVVGGWVRVSSNRIREDLKRVSLGEFDFGPLEHQLFEAESVDEEDD